MSLPFAPPPGHQPLLPNNAKAGEQFARLLDALLVLDAERSCRIVELAARVGLEPGRLRSLLSAFMTAGADVLETASPLSISFGTADGPFGADEEDDDAEGDVVWLETVGQGEWLVNELGRRPVMVKDVARALLAANLVLLDPDLPLSARPGVAALATTLAAGLQASVNAPVGSDAHLLHDAVEGRRRVRFRYRHPWTGLSTEHEVEAYDVRWHRDRLVLDAGTAGGEVTTYDVGSVSELVLLDETFAPRELPPRGERTERTEVVVRCPAFSPVEKRLISGWGARVVGPADDGQVDLRLLLDGAVGEPGVVERFGTLLLQLGPTVRVLSPEGLRAAAAPVAARLLALHS